MNKSLVLAALIAAASLAACGDKKDTPTSTMAPATSVVVEPPASVIVVTPAASSAMSPAPTVDASAPMAPAMADPAASTTKP